MDRSGAWGSGEQGHFSEELPFLEGGDGRGLVTRFDHDVGLSLQTVLHRIDGESPLRDLTPESMKGADIELSVGIAGIDGTTFQTLHARHRYLPEEFRFGVRYADMLTPKPDGRVELDYSKLHDTVPAAFRAAP